MDSTCCYLCNKMIHATPARERLQDNSRGVDVLVHLECWKRIAKVAPLE